MGSTGNSIKERYGNHKSSFNNIKKRHITELVNYAWDLKMFKVTKKFIAFI